MNRGNLSSLIFYPLICIKSSTILFSFYCEPFHINSIWLVNSKGQNHLSFVVIWIENKKQPLMFPVFLADVMACSEPNVSYSLLWNSAGVTTLLCITCTRACVTTLLCITCTRARVTTLLCITCTRTCVITLLCITLTRACVASSPWFDVRVCAVLFSVTPFWAIPYLYRYWY